MSWIAWWMLAMAAEQGCELRGLPVRVVYEASGVVTVYDVDEVLAEVETGGLKVEETRVSCSGDRIRLVQGGNVDEEGAHSALSIDAIDLNFAPVLDALPAERFDPHAAGVRRARRAAAKADFVAMDQHLQQVQPISASERDGLVEVLLREGSRASVGRAWSLVAGSTSPHRGEAGRTLLEMHLDEGSIDAARELVEKLEDVAGYCEWAGRVDWARGKKGKARKRWMTCTELSEEARAWCGTCDG